MKLPFSRTFRNWVIDQKLKALSSKEHWIISPTRMREWQEWNEFYLPIKMKGKTILDIGAGEGETAFFFLLNGAKKVFCVEPNIESYRILAKNEKLHKDVVAFNRPFELSDLKLPYDFLKMDTEGYEESLLSVRMEKPAVVEVHGLQLRDKFQKLGYRIANRHIDNTDTRGFGCLSYAYWNC